MEKITSHSYPEQRLTIKYFHQIVGFLYIFIQQQFFYNIDFSTTSS